MDLDARLIHLVYVSRLKALNNDIQRNLQEPLYELRELFEDEGEPFPEIRVAVRTGDTPASARTRMLRTTPHILITTPESLHIMLTTERARGMFSGVRAVIVDEIHAVAGTKRGAHLALTLERLEALVRACLGTIVLLRTGWSERWPDRRAYLGDDTPGDASRLHFPSYGEDAARLLVDERGVAALGADVASIDYGQSRDFIVHRIAAERNVPGFENLTNLGELPARGALVMALPMKIEGGSGGPLRAVALVPR